jgi:hypothetical protein
VGISQHRSLCVLQSAARAAQYKCCVLLRVLHVLPMEGCERILLQGVSVSRNGMGWRCWLCWVIAAVAVILRSSIMCCTSSPSPVSSAMHAVVLKGFETKKSKCNELLKKHWGFCVVCAQHHPC